MKKSIAAFVLCLASACATAPVAPPAAPAAAAAPPGALVPRVAPPPVVATAPIPPLGGPAPTTRAGQRELQIVLYFFTGSYELVPSKYLPAEFNRPAVAHVAPFWTDRTPGEYWLYFEFARTGEAQPFDQRIYRMRETRVFEHYEMASYRLPGAASAYAGEWRKEKPFEKLAPADLTELSECRMSLTRNVVAFYVGGTMGAHCRETPGTPADYEHTEFKLSSSNFHFFPRGFDASGRQISGPPGPVEFRKISNNPR